MSNPSVKHSAVIAAQPEAPPKPSPPRPPQHLRCDVRLELEGRHQDFHKIDVSASGIARLPIPDPSSNALGELVAGQRAKVQLTLVGPKPENSTTLTILGRITRERTLDESCYGFAFDWFEQDAVRDILLKALSEWGYAAEPNRRKHERTKALSTNPVVPIVAQFRICESSAIVPQDSEGAPLWTARIHNLSPGGLLISTESPEAAGIKPGDGLTIIIQPRDAQGFMIETLGGVRRVLEHVERTDSGETMVRSLGIRFEWLDEDQRSIYLSLLKCIA